MRWSCFILLIALCVTSRAEPFPDYWWNGDKVLKKGRDGVWREVDPASVTLKRPGSNGDFIIEGGRILRKNRGVYEFVRNVTKEDLISLEQEKPATEVKKRLLKISLKPFLSDEKRLKTVLQGLSFAVNSINTTSSKVFNPFEEIKKKYKDGVPKDGEIELDLSPFLTEKQLTVLLDQVVEKDPYRCNSVVGTRSEHFITSIFTQPSVYHRLLDLKDGFPKETNTFSVPQEFDGKDTTKKLPKSARLLADEGESGIAFEQRAVVAYKLNDGRIFARSYDLSKDNPDLKDKNNFFKNPHRVKPDAHEEIGELQNGFRFYALRDSSGKLQDKAPEDVVFEDIRNPVSCFRCHDSAGYRAQRSRKIQKAYKSRNESTNAPTEAFTAIFGKSQDAIDEYKSLVDPANVRYEAAKKKAGIEEGIVAIMNSFGKFTVDLLLQELGAESDQKELLKKLLRENEIEVDAEGVGLREEIEKKNESGKSIFCALKSKLQTARGSGRQQNSTQTHGGN